MNFSATFRVTFFSMLFSRYYSNINLPKQTDQITRTDPKCTSGITVDRYLPNPSIQASESASPARWRLTFTSALVEE